MAEIGENRGIEGFPAGVYFGPDVGVDGWLGVIEGSFDILVDDNGDVTVGLHFADEMVVGVEESEGGEIPFEVRL